MMLNAISIGPITWDLRTCLVSLQYQRNKSNVEHSKGSKKMTFTILPKSSTVI